jgi:hypothetical protein
VIDIINDSGGENHHPLQVTPEFSLGTLVLMANTLLIDMILAGLQVIFNYAANCPDR